MLTSQPWNILARSSTPALVTNPSTGAQNHATFYRQPFNPRYTSHRGSGHIATITPDMQGTHTFTIRHISGSSHTTCSNSKATGSASISIPCPLPFQTGTVAVHLVKFLRPRHTCGSLALGKRGGFFCILIRSRSPLSFVQFIVHLPQSFPLSKAPRSVTRAAFFRFMLDSRFFDNNMSALIQDKLQQAPDESTDGVQAHRIGQLVYYSSGEGSRYSSTPVTRCCICSFSLLPALALPNPLPAVYRESGSDTIKGVDTQI
jgi:hypothetical protein